jgi:hypothetical protein
VADDPLDFLESLSDGPQPARRFTRRRVAKPSLAGPLIVSVVVVVAGAYAAYRLIPRADDEWVNAPKTYAEAVQLWKTEIEMYALIKSGRDARIKQLADQITTDHDGMGGAFLPKFAEYCRQRLPQDEASLAAETRELDAKVVAQEARVERARKRKDELDH